ncbi:PIN domain-containing protein [Phormidesmis priestleyi]
MAIDKAVFIDTNILIYAKLSLSPFHQQAIEKLQTLEAAETQLWVSRQILREYLSALTRPNDLTAPISVAALVEDVRYFASQFQVAEESREVTDRLLVLIEQVSVGGKQIHDSNIVATMQAHEIRSLLTHNTQDFNRFSNVITVRYYNQYWMDVEAAVADTGFVVALLNRSDQSHAAAASVYLQQQTVLLPQTTLTEQDVIRVAAILDQYADSRIDFVDATVMAIAERYRSQIILTLDQRDFRMFRPQHCESFILLP